MKNKIIESEFNNDKNIVKHIIINYKLLYKIYVFNFKFNIDLLKKNENLLISNSKYYYYLINKDNIICSIYEYNNKHIIFFNGLLKKDINICNIFKKISIKYYNMKYNLILMLKNKIIKLKKNIKVYDAIEYISNKHQNNIYEIYSICFGSYIADLFLNDVVVKNKIQINKYYIYESINFNKSSLIKNRYYIFNNGSYFLFLGLLLKYIENVNLTTININKLSFDYFNGFFPLYNVFFEKHVLSIYRELKSENL